MDALQKKTFTTSRSLTYTYYYHPGSADKPTVVLQHGWPDSAHLWAGVIPHLLPVGHPLIIPDMLGYGGSSKPTETALYAARDLASDMLELCDAETPGGAIISLGHDWGSIVAQRLYLFHPQRVVGLVLMNVYYSAPTLDAPFDYEATLAEQERTTGAPRFAYWDFFSAPDAAALAERDLQKVYSMLHGAAPKGHVFCKRGGMREFIENGVEMPVKPYAQDSALRDAWVERMARDGLEAPFQYYRAFKEDVNFEREKELKREDLVIRRPVLFIGCKGDGVCLTSFMDAPIQAGLLPDLRMKEVDCGHWGPLEKPDETGSIIVEYLRETKF